MKKSNVTTDKYKLNGTTNLVVRNEPITDDNGQSIGYKHTVTLKHLAVTGEPLTFKDPDAISDFINNIDLDEEQLSLLA